MARHDQEPYHRGLCAGSERRRVCLGSLYCTSLHCPTPPADTYESRAGKLRQPDHVHSPAQNFAYTRVSNALQGKSGLGLEAQQAALARLAEAEGHWLVETSQKVEIGKGSDALDRGRQLAAALKATHKHKADHRRQARSAEP
jgi:hypothetical protein